MLEAQHSSNVSHGTSSSKKMFFSCDRQALSRWTGRQAGRQAGRVMTQIIIETMALLQLPGINKLPFVHQKELLE